ncbi:MAG: hypothetical protein Q8Q09_00605 [Deltaproteobacteria bacterium]|nr:hypothetical protein [Deltaproteobacteria bacterium]
MVALKETTAQSPELLVRYVLGAHFACLRCLYRSVSPRCVRCRALGVTVDLREAQGRHELALLRESSRLGSVGRESGDVRWVRTLPWGRRMVWWSVRIAFLLGFMGWFLFAPGVLDAPFLLGRLLFAGVMGTLAVLATLVGFALVLGALVGTVGIVASMGQLARGTRGHRNATRATLLFERTLLWIETGFLLRLRVDVSTPALAHGLAPVRGTWAQGRLVVARELRGTLVVSDAEPCSWILTLDDQSQCELDLTVGVVEVHDSALRGPKDNPSEELKSVDSLAKNQDRLVSSWLDRESTARAQTAVVTLCAPMRVEVSGGTWEEVADDRQSAQGFRAMSLRKVLRGSEQSPVFVRLRADAEGETLTGSEDGC